MKPLDDKIKKEQKKKREGGGDFISTVYKAVTNFVILQTAQQ